MSVFYIKYRPQMISELDLEGVRVSLGRILANKDVPLSFLFAGPKGSGKTSAARILAKSVNCLKLAKGGEPCGGCESCKLIAAGQAIDVLEIDAASNRGIDDVRSLREKAYSLPIRLGKKVFIIDEVHMLTKEAFNALLKLIEEPPKHTVFVMCTTDPQKIPETVLSRLVRIDFGRASKKEMVASLARVIEAEGMTVDDEVLEAVVRQSDGSFRNGARILTELYLELGKKINAKNAEEILKHKWGDYGEIELENDLAEGRVRAILQRFEVMAGSGVDFGAYRQRLVMFFQKQLLSSYGLTGGETKNRLDVVVLSRWLNLLIMAGKQEKDVEIGQLPLELAVVELLGEGRDGDAEEGKKGGQSGKLQFSNSKKEEKINEQEVAVGVEIATVEKEWERILKTVKPYNHSIEAFLRSARPKKIDGQSLVIEVFYPFHKERLEEEKNRRVVERVLTEVLNCQVLLECVLATSKKPPLVISNQTPVDPPAADIYDLAKEIFG